jgi:hypothetical protein
METNIKTGFLGAVIGATVLGGGMYLTNDNLAQAGITKIDDKNAEVTLSVTETVNVDEKNQERESLVARKQILQIKIQKEQEMITQIDSDIETIDNLIADLKTKGVE